MDVVQALAEKIGHSIVSIRTAALLSIRFKLEHGLIHISDLVHETTLHINLFEWFNKPEVPLHTEVLELLLEIAKHPSGIDSLLAIGALNFLTSPFYFDESEDLRHRFIDPLLFLLGGAPPLPSKLNFSSHEATHDKNENTSVSLSLLSPLLPADTSLPTSLLLGVDPTFSLSSGEDNLNKRAPLVEVITGPLSSSSHLTSVLDRVAVDLLVYGNAQILGDAALLLNCLLNSWSLSAMAVLKHSEVLRNLCKAITYATEEPVVHASLVDAMLAWSRQLKQLICLPLVASTIRSSSSRSPSLPLSDAQMISEVCNSIFLLLLPSLRREVLTQSITSILRSISASLHAAVKRSLPSEEQKNEWRVRAKGYLSIVWDAILQQLHHSVSLSRNSSDSNGDFPFHAITPKIVSLSFLAGDLLSFSSSLFPLQFIVLGEDAILSMPLLSFLAHLSMDPLFRALHPAHLGEQELWQSVKPFLSLVDSEWAADFEEAEESCASIVALRAGKVSPQLLLGLPYLSAKEQQKACYSLLHSLLHDPSDSPYALLSLLLHPHPSSRKQTLLCLLCVVGDLSSSSPSFTVCERTACSHAFLIHAAREAITQALVKEDFLVPWLTWAAQYSQETQSMFAFFQAAVDLFTPAQLYSLLSCLPILQLSSSHQQAGSLCLGLLSLASTKLAEHKDTVFFSLLRFLFHKHRFYRSYAAEKLLQLFLLPLVGLGGPGVLNFTFLFRTRISLQLIYACREENKDLQEVALALAVKIEDSLVAVSGMNISAPQTIQEGDVKEAKELVGNLFNVLATPSLPVKERVEAIGQLEHFAKRSITALKGLESDLVRSIVSQLVALLPSVLKDSPTEADTESLEVSLLSGSIRLLRSVYLASEEDVKTKLIESLSSQSQEQFSGFQLLIAYLLHPSMTIRTELSAFLAVIVFAESQFFRSRKGGAFEVPDSVLASFLLPFSNIRVYNLLSKVVLSNDKLTKLPSLSSFPPRYSPRTLAYVHGWQEAMSDTVHSHTGASALLHPSKVLSPFLEAVAALMRTPYPTLHTVTALMREAEEVKRVSNFGKCADEFLRNGDSVRALLSCTTAPSLTPAAKVHLLKLMADLLRATNLPASSIMITASFLKTFAPQAALHDLAKRLRTHQEHDFPALSMLLEQITHVLRCLVNQPSLARDPQTLEVVHTTLSALQTLPQKAPVGPPSTRMEVLADSTRRERHVTLVSEQYALALQMCLAAVTAVLAAGEEISLDAAMLMQTVLTLLREAKTRLADSGPKGDDVKWLMRIQQCVLLIYELSKHYNTEILCKADSVSLFTSVASLPLGSDSSENIESVAAQSIVTNISTVCIGILARVISHPSGRRHLLFAEPAFFERVFRDSIAYLSALAQGETASVSHTHLEFLLGFSLAPDTQRVLAPELYVQHGFFSSIVPLLSRVNASSPPSSLAPVLTLLLKIMHNLLAQSPFTTYEAMKEVSIWPDIVSVALLCSKPPSFLPEDVHAAILDLCLGLLRLALEHHGKHAVAYLTEQTRIRDLEGI